MTSDCLLPAHASASGVSRVLPLYSRCINTTCIALAHSEATRPREATTCDANTLHEFGALPDAPAVIPIANGTCSSGEDEEEAVARVRDHGHRGVHQGRHGTYHGHNMSRRYSTSFACSSMRRGLAEVALVNGGRYTCQLVIELHPCRPCRHGSSSRSLLKSSIALSHPPLQWSPSPPSASTT